MPFLRQWSQVGHSRAQLSRKEMENWAMSLDTLLESRGKHSSRQTAGQRTLARHFWVTWVMLKQRRCSANFDPERCSWKLRYLWPTANSCLKCCFNENDMRRVHRINTGSCSVIINMNTLKQQVCIKLIKSDSKDIYNVKKN